MIKLTNIKKILNILFFSCIAVNLYCQQYSIDYLGIVSKEIDPNMAKMTSDLYYTQLNELQEITINDKRSDNLLLEIPETSSLSNQNLSFYAVIGKSQKSDKWITVIHVYNPVSSNDISKAIEYDSFYKILMESKNTLQETIKNLIDNKQNQNTESYENEIFATQKITSTENLSGTWLGEEYIDKIIIMRGGRGFIIFNNGASMTISVSLENENNKQKVVILQNGHSNASFYPNLPRNIAVNAALEAEPLQWMFYITDGDTLTGTKKTLIAKDESFDYVSEDVKWKRLR